MSPAIEAVAMMWPPPASIMSGRKVRAVQIDALQVDLGHPVELALGELGHRHERRRPGVGEHELDGPERGVGLGLHLLDRGAVADVAVDRDRRAAGVVDLVGDLAGVVRQDVRDGDGGALAGQLLGQAHADAAAAAGDDGRLAGDLGHAAPLGRHVRAEDREGAVGEPPAVGGPLQLVVELADHVDQPRPDRGTWRTRG